MHHVAVLVDQPPSQATTTAVSDPPIGPYHRVPVRVHQADPHAPAVAGRLIALIAASYPATPAEHVGSSAVPGLAGKNIIDLLMASPPADIAAITAALLELGFQHQSPAAFPASRPMLWGAFRHGRTEHRVHVHVVPASSPEVAAMRGFRDALRADPRLRRQYAALKRGIVAGGPVDPVAFTRAKHDWIVAALGQLGLAGDQHHRLYDDAPALPRRRTTYDQRVERHCRAGAVGHSVGAEKSWKEKERQMTIAAPELGSRAGRIEATHVTGRRVVATIVDGLVFGVAYWLLALAFGDIRTEGEAANFVSDLPVWASVAYGLFVIGYYILLEGLLGQTLGKLAVGIKVVAEATGQAPGMAAAAVRTVLRLIDGLFSYAVAFITVLVSSRRQRLGDMAARTLVVRT